MATKDDTTAHDKLASKTISEVNSATAMLSGALSMLGDLEDYGQGLELIRISQLIDMAKEKLEAIALEIEDEGSVNLAAAA